MKTPQDKLKRRIINLIRQHGLPADTQYIADHITLPEDIALSDLLSELVAEKRLQRNYTFRANGDPNCIYNLIS